MSWKLLDEPANDKLLFLKKDKEMVYVKDICYWKLYMSTISMKRINLCNFWIKPRQSIWEEWAYIFGDSSFFNVLEEIPTMLVEANAVCVGLVL